MAATVVTLIHGLRVGESVLREAELRELTAGDILDAQDSAEKLVQTAAGPQLVASPARVGVELLRRQIVRIGADRDAVAGPISLGEIRKLHPDDLELLQRTAAQLDAATAAETGHSVAKRGRD